MKISEMASPTPGVILIVKKSYNRILKRYKDAEIHIDRLGVPTEEKAGHSLIFRIEIINALNEYLEVLKDWKVEVSDMEISNGFTV